MWQFPSHSSSDSQTHSCTHSTNILWATSQYTYILKKKKTVYLSVESDLVAHDDFFSPHPQQSSQTLPNRRLRNVFPQSQQVRKDLKCDPAPLSPPPPHPAAGPGHSAAYCDFRSSKPFFSSNKCIHLTIFSYPVLGFFSSSFFHPSFFSSFSFQVKQICMSSGQIKKNPHLSNSQA